MNKDNKYIGYVLNDNKVVFKVEDKVYIKKIKEKNKVRKEPYSFSESITIICKNLNDNYVVVDSNNKLYYNKTLLVFNIIFNFVFSFLIIINIYVYEHISIYEIIYFILIFFIFLYHIVFSIYLQKKKKYNEYIVSTTGKIIDYSFFKNISKERISKYDYRVMYKYKISDKIIHSVVDLEDAKFKFKDYPVNSSVLIRYNPNNYCESCLIDEYDYLINNIKKEHNFLCFRNTTGTITDIKTKCIDEEMDEELKGYFLVDLIECEYVINSKIYKNYSTFCVLHDKYKIGDKVNVMYDSDDKNNFYCDL